MKLYFLQILNILKFISKHLKKKINNIIEAPNSEIKKAWKEYSKDKIFDDHCEELKAEMAYKDGFNAGYFRGSINND